MNINEVRIERGMEVLSEQPILEIKEHLMDCYEVEIPIGNKIIIDKDSGSGVVPYLPLPELKKKTN